MKFNALIPELAVTNLEKSQNFYTKILPFKVWYERTESKLVVIEYEGSQIIIFQSNDRWKTGQLEYPLGRGINFEITTSSIQSILNTLSENKYPLFRPVADEWYRVNDELKGNRQFLVQDPDGYLLRFTENLGTRPLK